MFGPFFHATFLATIMSIMIRRVRLGGGYGRRFDHDSHDLMILRLPIKIKESSNLTNQGSDKLSNIYVISISPLGL